MNTLFERISMNPNIKTAIINAIKTISTTSSYTSETYGPITEFVTTIYPPDFEANRTKFVKELSEALDKAGAEAIEIKENDLKISYPEEDKDYVLSITTVRENEHDYCIIYVRTVRY